jgi:hypothetical protein
MEKVASRSHVPCVEAVEGATRSCDEHPFFEDFPARLLEPVGLGGERVEARGRGDLQEPEGMAVSVGAAKDPAAEGADPLLRVIQPVGVKERLGARVCHRAAHAVPRDAAHGIAGRSGLFAKLRHPVCMDYIGSARDERVGHREQYDAA